MNKTTTKGIVLRRVNYGEADRIITLLTPDLGAVTALAKAVRKPQSKLAGGLELFSESDVTILKGKGELDHIISARLVTHSSHIVEDYERVEAAYQTIEFMYKLSRETMEEGMYQLLRDALKYLDDNTVSIALVKSWYLLNILKLLGSQPNFDESIEGKLEEGSTYSFDHEMGVLKKDANGIFGANEIKAWRLVQGRSIQDLKKVSGLDEPLAKTLSNLEQFFRFTLGV